MPCPKCESKEVADLIQSQNKDVEMYLKFKKCHDCSCVYMELNLSHKES